MIKFKEYKDIEYTSKGGVLPLNSKIADDDMLVARVFYDDAWTGKVKGIMTFQWGSSQNDNTSLPDENSGFVKEAIKNGFLFVMCFYWKEFPNTFSYNHFFPTYEHQLGALEQESFMEFIEGRLKKDATFIKYISQDTKIFLTGQSKGAGQILGWSRIFGDPTKDHVVGGLSNSPVTGGNSYSQVDRLIRSIGNAITGDIKHPFTVLFPINDKTHTYRSMVELIYPFCKDSNNLITPVVYGDSSDYTHGWVYRRPEEFISLASGLFDDYIGM